MGERVTVETDVEQRLADGTILRADVYTPEGPGPYPVLICRTPYRKSAPRNVHFAETLAARGYVTLVQDVRGTHASDGDFVWHNEAAALDIEAQDGYECVEWAARLPKSDGRVGTFGVSYAAWLNWSLTKTCPPSLKAMQASGITENILDMNFGIVETGRRLHWAYSIGAALRARTGDTRYPASIEQGDEDWMGRLRSKWIWRLPLSSIPDEEFGPLGTPLKTYLAEQDKEYWGLGRFHRNVTYPVCIQTGWWDRFSLSYSHYTGLRDHGPEELSGKHRLIVGPWPHFPMSYRRDIGPVDYGPTADASYPDIAGDWYDCHFKGCEAGFAAGPPVQLFILNEGWRGFSDWPPPGTVETPLYLSSGGQANTPSGDGRLQWETPGDESPDSYDYDPADPVMSLMGLDAQLLPVDQKANARRSDILVYQTRPLERAVTVAGPVMLDLWAASDRVDTDFCATLIEVRPDGTAINLSTGILRARYRKGFDREVPLEPHRPTRFSIRMLPAGIRFEPGSRIRLDVTSSDFPAHDRNHNTGGEDWRETTLLVARQTVFHDTVRPSRLLLPLLREQAAG